MSLNCTNDSDKLGGKTTIALLLIKGEEVYSKSYSMNDLLIVSDESMSDELIVNWIKKLYFEDFSRFFSSM